MNILTYININIRIVLTIGIVLLTIQKGKAQDKMELTLKDAINLAIKNNWQMRKAVQNEGIASAEHRQSKSVFLPNINLSKTFMTTPKRCERLAPSTLRSRWPEDVASIACGYNRGP